MKRTFCFIAIALISGMTARAEQDPVVAQANRDYAAGDFRKAIDGYNGLVNAGRWSANLLYDLGNAWYRAGDPGKAILNYERALALEPHHPEAQANLRLVRDQARSLELRSASAEQFVSFGTTNQWTIAAAISFWVAAFVAVSLLFAPRRSMKRIVLLAVAIVVSTASIAAVWLRENGIHGHALAIVTGKNIEARIATADTAATVLALPPGSEVQIVSVRGDWSYAVLPNQQHGWIPASAAEIVRL